MSEHQVDIVDTTNKESSYLDEDISGSAFEDHSDTSALMELAEIACQSSTADASTNFQQALPAPTSVNFSNSCRFNQNNDSTDKSCNSATENFDNSIVNTQLHRSPLPIPTISQKEDKMLSTFSTSTEENRADRPCQFVTFTERNDVHLDEKVPKKEPLCVKEILNQSQIAEMTHINVQKSFDLPTSDTLDASSTSSKISLQKISHRKKSVSIFDNSDSSDSDDISIEDNLIHTQKDIFDAKPNINEVKYSLNDAEKTGLHNDEKLTTCDILKNDCINISKEEESDCIKVNHSNEDLQSVGLSKTELIVSYQCKDSKKLPEHDIDKLYIYNDQESTETVLRNVCAVNETICEDKTLSNDVINSKIEKCVTLDSNVKPDLKGGYADFFNKDLENLSENFDTETESYQAIKCAETIQDGNIDSRKMVSVQNLCTNDGKTSPNDDGLTKDKTSFYDSQECEMSLDEEPIALEANNDQNNDKTRKFSDFCEKEPSACVPEKKGNVQSVLGDDKNCGKFSMEGQCNNPLESGAVNSELKSESIRSLTEPEIGEDIDEHESNTKNNAESIIEDDIGNDIESKSGNNSESDSEQKTDSGDHLEVKSEDISLIPGSTVETMYYTDMFNGNITKSISKILKNSTDAVPECSKSTYRPDKGNEDKQERETQIVGNDDLLNLNSGSNLDAQNSETNINLDNNKTTESAQLAKNLFTNIAIKDDNEGTERKIDKDIAVERENNFELTKEEDCLDLNRKKSISNLASDCLTDYVQNSHNINSVTSDFTFEIVKETINVNKESSGDDKDVELAANTDASSTKDNVLDTSSCVFIKEFSVTSNDEPDDIIDNFHTCESSTLASADTKVTNCKNVSDASMISSDICKDLSLEEDTSDCCKNAFNTDKGTLDSGAKKDSDTCKDTTTVEKCLADPGKNYLFSSKIILDRPTHDTIENFESLDTIKDSSMPCEDDMVPWENNSATKYDTLDSCCDERNSNEEGFKAIKDSVAVSKDLHSCKDVLSSTDKALETINDASDGSIYANEAYTVAVDMSKVVTNASKEVESTGNDISNTCSKKEALGTIVDISNTVMDNSATCKNVLNSVKIASSSNESLLTPDRPHKDVPDSVNDSCHRSLVSGVDTLDTTKEVPNSSKDDFDRSNFASVTNIDVSNISKAASDICKDSSDPKNNTGQVSSDTCKDDSISDRSDETQSVICNNEVNVNKVDFSVTKDALHSAKDDSVHLLDSSDSSKGLTDGSEDVIDTCKGVSDVSTDITDASKEVSNLSTNVSDAKTVVLAVCEEDKTSSVDMSDVPDKNNIKKTEATRFNDEDVEKNDENLNFSDVFLNNKQKISDLSEESESLCTRSIQQSVLLEANVGLIVKVNEKAKNIENDKDCNLNGAGTQAATLNEQISLSHFNPNKIGSLKEAQAVTSISQSRKRTRTNSLEDNCVVKKVKFSEPLHKADTEDSDIESDLDDPNRLVIIENENELTHNNSIITVAQEKSVIGENDSQTESINPDTDADAASDIEVIDVINEAGSVKKYSAEEICEKCCDTWNYSILKLLFEGNESVTIKSKITYGAIICMNNYAKLRYRHKEEMAVRKLLHRAGLGLSKNLASIKISELNHQILARIKNGRMSCCDVFYLLYLVKKGSVNNAVNKNSKLKIDYFINIDDEPSSEDKLSTSSSSTPVTNETPQEIESISSQASNIIETEISFSVQTEASHTNRPIAKTIIPTNWEIISQPNNKKIKHMQKIIATERENLSYDVVEFYDQLPCPVVIPEKEILAFKQKNLTNSDVLNIFFLFKKDNKLDCNIFFKLLFQIAFLRSRILLIPDGPKLVDIVEDLAKSLSNINNVNFEFDEWDNEHLYSTPIYCSPTGKYPTIREILALFCSWNSKTLLSSQQYKEFDLKVSLFKLFREKVNLNDSCGLCIRLYERYCSLLFQQKEPAKANLYLNLFYLPKKEQSAVKRATILPRDISFLPPSNQNISKYIKYLNDSGSQPSRLKRKLPDSIVNYKLIQTKKMKMEILNRVKDEKIQSLLNTYSHIHPEVNKGETPVASSDRQLAKSSQSRAMVSKMYSILKADNVPNDKIDVVISKVLSIIR